MPDEQPAQLNDLQQSNMNGETGELVETAKPVIVPGRQKWLVLIAVSIGTFMATLDGSIVNISLPKIQEAFGVNLSTIEWVVVTYLLIRGALMLPFGRLGEMIGYKRVYITGFIIFTSASALCGISQSVWMLVGFRALQAFGGAMLSAIGPAIVTYTFGSGERGKALGLNSISVSIGLSIGPTVGGILTEYGSWRWIFWVNIPVGIIATLWAMRVLENQVRGARQSFDLLGAFLSFTALFSLLLALVQGQSWGWVTAPIIALIVLFAVLGTFFILTELHVKMPMLDLQLFKNWTFSAGNATLLISFAGSFIASFLLPFFLEQGQGFSPLRAGLLLTPIPLTTMLIAPFSGALSDRIGEWMPATAGMGITALGFYFLTRISIGTSTLGFIWPLVIIGIGQGVFSSPNSSAILGAVPQRRLGTAAGTLAQMRTNGQVVGIALGGLIVANRTPLHVASLLASHSVAQDMVQRLALILSIHDAFYFAMAISIVAMFTAMVHGNRDRRPGNESPRAQVSE